MTQFDEFGVWDGNFGRLQAIYLIVIPMRTEGLTPCRHSRGNGNLIRLDPRVKPEDDAIFFLGEDDAFLEPEMTPFLRGEDDTFRWSRSNTIYLEDLTQNRSCD